MTKKDYIDTINKLWEEMHDLKKRLGEIKKMIINLVESCLLGNIKDGVFTI